MPQLNNLQSCDKSNVSQMNIGFQDGDVCIVYGAMQIQ
jgi:hypothetical protein